MKLSNALKMAKAIVALLLAVLTAAAGIWTGNEYITFGLAVLTAVSVFFTKNKKTLEDLLAEVEKTPEVQATKPGQVVEVELPSNPDTATDTSV